jgi:peroxiredoxin
VAAESTMMELGTAAPWFQLTDTASGNKVRLSDFDDAAALVVVFVSNHCPYVQHMQHGLAELGRDYRGTRAAIVAIGSNDPIGYPDDSPEELGRVARQIGYTFPVLFDADQATALAYGAACTPDFFLFGADCALVYRGRFDESRPRSDVPVTGRDLRLAIDAVLAGEPVDDNQYPSLGCSIKWTRENAPAGHA